MFHAPTRRFSLEYDMIRDILYSAALVITALVATIALDAVFDPTHWLLVGVINYTWVSIFLLWVTDAFILPFDARAEATDEFNYRYIDKHGTTTNFAPLTGDYTIVDKDGNIVSVVLDPKKED